MSSRWTPPPVTPKRFLTWFFLAPAPRGSVSIDHGEIHEHAWMSPTGAHARQAAAEIELAPPTWVTWREKAVSVSGLTSAGAPGAVRRIETGELWSMAKPSASPSRTVKATMSALTAVRVK